MDWSLALASQSVACVIHPPAPGGSWALEVDAADAGSALRTLRLYHRENRRWQDALQPGSEALPFHWAVLPWCLFMLAFAWAAGSAGSRLGLAGSFATASTASGDWWRPLTATFLHAGPDHLAANLATGFVLLGLAMGRFGPGSTLLGSLVAGVVGNLAAWALRGHDYVGLGSSGVVMGALGMLAVSLISETRVGRVAPSTCLRGLLGGLALFILLGTSPNSDVLAHAGGFGAGLVLAGAAAWLPDRWRKRPGFEFACGCAYFVASLAGWVAALR